MNENSATPKLSKKVIDLSRFFLLFLLISFLAFGLGRLSALEDNKDPIRIEYDLNAIPEITDEDTSLSFEEVGSVVVSKNGSVYHLPWCPGAQRIKEDNKIWFSSVTEAEEAGYSPAKNCKGLE